MSRASAAHRRRGRLGFKHGIVCSFLDRAAASALASRNKLYMLRIWRGSAEPFRNVGDQWLLVCLPGAAVERAHVIVIRHTEGPALAVTFRAPFTQTHAEACRVQKVRELAQLDYILVIENGDLRAPRPKFRPIAQVRSAT